MSLAGLYNYPGRIRTYTGLFVDPFDMNEEDIDIEDIAHALSHIPRFAGHTKKFYSVAQHCVWVAEHCPQPYMLGGLLHDAAEAYLMDIPTPVKERIPGYKEAEHRILVKVAIKFKADVFHSEVKAADKLALEYEWANCVLEHNTHFFKPELAKQVFLEMFNKLSANKSTVQWVRSTYCETIKP